MVTDKNFYPFKKLVLNFYKNEENLLQAFNLDRVDSGLFDNRQDIKKTERQVKVYKSRSYTAIFNAEKDYLNIENRKKIIKILDFENIFESQEYREAVRPFGPLSGTWAQSNSFVQINEKYETKDKVDIPSKLSIVIPNVPQALLVSKEIEKQLEKRDISAKVTTLEPKNFTNEIRELDYDIVITAFEYGADPDRYVFWHSSQIESGLNFTNLESIRMDQAIEKGREELTISERKKHYDIFQEAFSAESPAFFILHPAQFLYYKKRILIPDDEIYKPSDIFDNFRQWEVLEKKNFFSD